MHRNLSLLGRWSLCAAMLLALAQTGLSQPEYDSNWAKNFRVGGMVGFNIKANFRMTGTFGVSGSHQPGTYDDGYVRTDSTGDEGGRTWNWGYENANQYDAANNRLLMHSASTFTANQSASKQDAPYIGFDMAYGGILWRRNQFRVGWEFGFGMLPIKISDTTPIENVNVSRSAVYFDVPAGVILPGAPYHGNAEGPGALISDAPHPLSEEGSTATITGNRTLDVNLYTFKLGPTFFWDVNQYVGLQVGAGPALGLVSGDLKFDETISFTDGGTAHNSGRVSATDMTYGGYVNALVTFHCVKNGDFYIGAQYMPMGKARIGGGGREAELDLKGQVYISAGINWPF